MDFKFVSHGLFSGKQNILLQHMHKKEFWILTNKCGNNLKLLIIITGEGGGGWCKKGEGQIFLCMKKGGGPKIFVQYKYLPGVTLPYYKTNK